VRHVEEVMGTVFTLDGVFDDCGPDESSSIVANACALLHEIDALFSTWDESTPLSQFRRGQLGADALPATVTEVLALCRSARTVSGGWFDPWMAPGGVDPTGYVKGWAGQRLLCALREASATAALVNAAGDIAAFGRPTIGQPWRVGITNPFSRHQVLGVVTLRDGAIAVSGTYERGSHIYGANGEPTQSPVVSAAVTGPDLGMADALATGLVAGGEAAIGPIEASPDHEALIVLDDGRQLRTPGFAITP
jgi:thiamine biosynthesis lipoprotein